MVETPGRWWIEPAGRDIVPVSRTLIPVAVLTPTMHCRVVVEAAVPVFDVETPDEAIRIAISKTGEMLNPDLNYVEIEMGSRTSPSGEELPPAFIAADEALVALELEMTVFNVEREEHAARIARKEIGQRLENIPLEVLEIEVLEEDDLEDETEDSADEDPQDSAAEDPQESTTDDTAGESGESQDERGESEHSSAGDTASEDERSDNGTSDEPVSEDGEDILPEFEDLVD